MIVLRTYLCAAQRTLPLMWVRSRIISDIQSVFGCRGDCRRLPISFLVGRRSLGTMMRANFSVEKEALVKKPQQISHV